MKYRIEKITTTRNDGSVDEEIKIQKRASLFGSWKYVCLPRVQTLSSERSLVLDAEYVWYITPVVFSQESEAEDVIKALKEVEDTPDIKIAIFNKFWIDGIARRRVVYYYTNYSRYVYDTKEEALDVYISKKEEARLLDIKSKKTTYKNF